MASLLEPIVDSSEPQSCEGTEVRAAEAQPAAKIRAMRSGHRRNHQLNRISSGIYERAAKLHVGELPRLARLSMAREFRPKLADLREQIKADILSLSD